MFEKELSYLEDKEFEILDSNSNTIYLKNDSIRKGVLLINKFSFKSKEANETINLFDENKTKEPYLEKQTIGFIKEILIQDREEKETEEEYKNRVLDDEYFFLKVNIEDLEKIPLEKLKIELNIKRLEKKEYIEFNTSEEPSIDNFLLDPFEKNEGRIMVNYLKWLKGNEKQYYLFLKVPISLNSLWRYFHYISEQIVEKVEVKIY